MRSRIAAGLIGIVLPVVGCSAGPATSDQMSYQIQEPLTALMISTRAASVMIEVGDGPVTVTEEHRYSAGRPTTAHRVEDRTLWLTETGCGGADDDRCDVSYTIRMPKAMSADITAKAGAVKINGLAGNVRVATDAGAVEGRGLTSAEVRITTDAGAASLEFVEAPTLVRTTTNVGAVELRVPGTTAYAVDIHTSIGDRTVDVDNEPTSTHRITVRTEVGSVKIGRLNQPGSTTKERLLGPRTSVAEPTPGPWSEKGQSTWRLRRHRGRRPLPWMGRRMCCARRNPARRRTGSEGFGPAAGRSSSPV